MSTLTLDFARSSATERAVSLFNIVGQSPIMKAVFQNIDKIAASDLPVLIRGDTGTGKELVARAIHALSQRRDAPFVTENCAALADGILEAELFGHEKGAFTGATAEGDGLFRRAHAGTLFVDEVGDMPLNMQAKILRVLQGGEIRRVGGSTAERVDVRVIAATHRNLEELVRAGTFRQDLLFRLDVLEVRLPALKERLDDIPVLAKHFLEKIARESNTGGVPLLLTDESLDALLSYTWPGNVRELENALRVAALFSKGPLLEAHALPLPNVKKGAISLSAAVAFPMTEDTALSYRELRAALDNRERNYIRAILKGEHGNKARAAKRLGMTRYSLYRALNRLDIEINNDVAEAG
jgi:transcriptional regulator with GAF, ATPase, and Fis domain